MTINLALDSRVRKDGTQSIMFHIVDGRGYRKKVFTDLKIESRFWDKKKQRVRPAYKNSRILNKDLDDWNEKMRTASDKYATKQFTREQVIAYISGKTNFDSVGDYVETEIKDSRSVPTYVDYRTAINSLKTHTGYSKDKPLLFQDVNYKLLDKFKRAGEDAGMSASAHNSYLNKIRAVMNDAYRKGFIYEEFKLDRRLLRPVKRKAVQTATPDEILDGIGKIKTIYDWQAVSFWILMFMTRGMYQADIVNFTHANIEYPDRDNIKDFEEWKSKRVVYLIHSRSKTSQRANEELKIRIDNHNLWFIEALKLSVVYTHYRSKPEIIPPLTDTIRIFKYDPRKDYVLHNNIWDYYKKQVSKLTGLSYNKARKTFNTIALELAVPDTIRRVLLGHADPSVLQHYDNFRTERFEKQVEDAHRAVLKDFRLNDILSALHDKLRTLDVPEFILHDNLLPDPEIAEEDAAMWMKRHE